MAYYFPLRYALCIVALFASPALAQRERGAGALPEEPDALVALMVGVNVHSESQMRYISNAPAVRAARALIVMKDDAVAALTRALDAEDHLLRLNAVYVLGRIGTPATVPLRIKAAADPHSEVRAQAVSGLPAYDNEEARRALLAALKDPDPVVRTAAIRAFRPRDEKNLPDNSKRFAAASALIPLLEEPATQYAAADTLGQIGMNIAARPLLKLLKVEDKLVRSAAVQALGRLKDKQVAVELTAALRDEDRHVRMYAARSLGEIGDLRTTPALVELLSEKEHFLRSCAAVALGQIGDVRAVPSLLSLLADPDETVRAAAAEALGEIGDVRAVEPLCAVLAREGRVAPNSREVWVYSAVARALGRLRDPRAIEPLKRYLLAPESRAVNVQDAAKALAQIRHPDSVAALVEVIVNTRSVDGVNTAAKWALRDLAGVSFSGDPNKEVAYWWSQNREHYLQPVPERK